MKVRVGVAQINTVVGDIKGNVAKVNNYITRALDAGADMVVFPELTISGYPPEDLLFLPGFVRDNISALNDIIKTSDIITVVGYADYDGAALYNAAAIIYNGRIVGKYYKHLLPNYGVFDEKRYFKEGRDAVIFKTRNFCFGVNICEDIWYQIGSTLELANKGAQFIINLSSSPYYIKKFSDRYGVLKARNEEVHLPIVYANLVGGQDELVFDGNSMVLSQSGELIAKAKEFEEDLLIVDLELPECSEVADDAVYIDYASLLSDNVQNRLEKKIEREEEEIYKALKLGLHDYFYKNGFNKAIIGISGGIDSALTLAIAVDAIGKDRVVAVSMPSVFSSEGTKSDAYRISKNFGVEFFELPIQNLFEQYLKELEPILQGKEWDVTEENIQARIRGNILMALSNKYNGIVIATGNKSELSMGYCTLYGDMVGGYAVLKDIYKTMVYRLARYRNELAGYDIIPQSIIDREPSAELKEGQKDTDSLPPYELLDTILYYYIEKNYSIKELIDMGYSHDLVKYILETVDKNEYKRRQGPPGIKITKRAFGKDRRMPIINKYIRK